MTAKKMTSEKFPVFVFNSDLGKFVEQAPAGTIQGGPFIGVPCECFPGACSESEHAQVFGRWVPGIYANQCHMWGRKRGVSCE